jgi:hypothetical protein
MTRPSALWETWEDEPGCAYLLHERGGVDRTCGAPRRHASSYCPTHHALCHVANGSPAEADHLRQVEALATVVGGRRSREGGAPSLRFLRRLERRSRSFVR